MQELHNYIKELDHTRNISLSYLIPECATKGSSVLSQVEDIFPFTPILRYRQHFLFIPHKKAPFLFSPICLVSLAPLESMCPVAPTPTHCRSPHLPTLDAGTFPVEKGSPWSPEEHKAPPALFTQLQAQQTHTPWEDEAQTPSPTLTQVSPLSTQLPPIPLAQAELAHHPASFPIWAA